MPTPLSVAAKKVSTATSSPVAWTSIWRSRNSGSKRSSAWICSSVSLILRLRTVSSSRSSRSWRVLRLPEDPHAPHPARTDLEPREHQLVGHSLVPLGRMLERMGPDRLLDQGRDAVGVRSLRSRQPVEQPLGAVHLEVAADLVEVLPAVAQDPARLRDVAEFLGDLCKDSFLRAIFSAWTVVTLFSSGLLSGLDTFSINLGEAGLATVPFGRHLSGDYRSTTRQASGGLRRPDLLSLMSPQLTTARMQLDCSQGRGVGEGRLWNLRRGPPRF